jgi:outer membrane receptor protein involved in Fe transport
VVLVLARTAAAQSGDEAAPEAAPAPVAPEAAPAEGEVIEVRARWPDADLFTVGHTTRATTTRRVSRDARAAVLGDVLDGVPGLAVQRTGPGQGAPIVRGLIGSAVLVVVDGMRLNNAIFRPAPNQYTALVDPLAISRVEITRGPGSALFGSDAIGGVINVVSPLPRFEGDAWQQQATAITGAASADRSVIGRAHVAAGRKGSGFSLGTTLQHHGDLRAGDGVMQAPSEYDSIAADATGHLESGRHATTAWLQVARQPSLPRTDEMRTGFGQEEPSSAVFRYRPSQRSFAHVRHLVRRPAGALEGVELHAAWQRIIDDRRLRDTGSDEELRESNHDDSIGVAARAVGPLLGGEITFGADHWFDRVASSRRSIDIVTREVMTDSGRFADGSTMNQLGGFGELHRRVGRVALRGALRAGLTRIRIAEADRGFGATIDSLNWAGELGGEIHLAREVYAVMNAGRAFRAPNIQDLSGLGPRPGNRYQIPSTDLGDEHSLGVDVGIRTRGERIEAELFGFGLVNDNRIEVVETGELTPDGREIVASANTAETRLLGIEAAIRARPHDAVEILASSTWVRGNQRTVAGHEPADRTPAAGGRAEVRWLALPRLRLDAAARGALAQRRLSERDRGDPRIDPTGTPGFVTLHAGVLLKLGEFEIAARLDNILDRAYREHGSGTESPGFDASLLIRWTSTVM